MATTAAQRVALGTCGVSFNGIDLGLTKGGVAVEISTETYKVQVDQFGNTEINEFIVGRSVKVTVPMAETDLDKLAMVIPGSNIVQGASSRKLSVRTATGVSLNDYRAVLQCRPINAPDGSLDFTLPLCASKGEFTFAYKLNEERIYSVEFTGYVNMQTGVLYILGDASADNTTTVVTPPPSSGAIVTGSPGNLANMTPTDIKAN